jgi:hypothetical protein
MKGLILLLCLSLSSESLAQDTLEDDDEILEGPEVTEPASPEVPRVEPDLRCYTPQQRKKIADAILDYRRCRASLASKERFIEDSLSDVAKVSQVAFWQEPEFVFGGIVFGVSVGALITYAVTH